MASAGSPTRCFTHAGKRRVLSSRHRWSTPVLPKPRRAFLLAVLFTAGLFPWSLNADREPRTLANKPRFAVIVESLDSDATRCGLTVPQVRTDVEIRLRRSGVVVVDQTTFGFLYVDISVLRTIPGRCAYNIRVVFDQPAYLLDGGRIVASTWDTGSLGVSPDTSGRDIRDALGDLVDQFVNDWLSVNQPKVLKPEPNR